MPELTNKNATFVHKNNTTNMNTDLLERRYRSVCAAPRGNGFIVEHMPQMFDTAEVDDCAPHVHAFYEILWFWDGTGQHTVDFVQYPVSPDTLFFLSPGQVHHFDVRQGYRGVAIKMCTDLMRDQPASSPTGEASSLFMKYNAFHTHDSSPCCHIDAGTATYLRQLVRQMEDEAQRAGEFGNTDVLRALITIFLTHIQRHGQHQGERLHLDMLRPSHQVFVQFRRMVEQEYTRLHTVQEYADRLNVAVRTLNKCVNECSQQSPLSYINGRIILEAKRLLRHTPMMIKEIAYELGYEDPSYFVKLFKRQTDHLPSDFREMEFAGNVGKDRG